MSRQEQIPISKDRILGLLADGPRPASVIRHVIGASTTGVFNALKALEAAGKVRMLGKGGYAQWALASWDPRRPVVRVPRQMGKGPDYYNAQTYSGIRSAAVALASRSWWAEPEFQTNRSRFFAFAAQEQQRIALSPVGDKIDSDFNN